MLDWASTGSGSALRLDEPEELGPWVPQPREGSGVQVSLVWSESCADKYIGTESTYLQLGMTRGDVQLQLLLIL
jgi:hypothetical protein